VQDLISRQAAIDEAEEWIEVVYCERAEQRERDAIKHVINGIKQLPSVQPERKPGHWIQVGCSQECSECGATYADLYPDYDETNYCPNCGADMRGEQG